MSNIAKAFNLWMDEYINDPDSFNSTTSGVLKHMREKLNGEPESYGDSCEATLAAYMDRVSNENDPENG